MSAPSFTTSSSTSTSSCECHEGGSIIASSPSRHHGLPPAAVRGVIEAPPYIAPTSALILHLTHFPLSHHCHADQLLLQRYSPLLYTLLSQSHASQIAWREVDPAIDTQSGVASTAASASSPAASSTALSSSDDDEYSSVTRLLGTNPTEWRAIAFRATELQRRRLAARVTSPSPSSAYPSTYGSCRIELASNVAKLVETCAKRRSENPIATAHVNQPQYINLTPASNQQEATGTILQHAASRLSLSLLSTTAPANISLSTAPSTTASPILVLHLDTCHLPLIWASSAASSTSIISSLQFIEQLLIELMTQLIDPRVSATSTSKSASGTAAASTTSTSSTATSTSSSISYSASTILDRAYRQTPHLMWCVILDPSNPSSSAMDAASTVSASPANPSTASPSATSQRSSLLSFLRPVQSYRVHDGYVEKRDDHWCHCLGYIYHPESIRVANSHLLAAASKAAAASSDSSSPIHTSPASQPQLMPDRAPPGIGIVQWMKELIYKIGRGGKYGA